MTVTPLRPEMVTTNGFDTHGDRFTNIESEQALLGAILCDNTAYFRVQAIVRPEDFAFAVHGKILQSIEQALSAGLQATPVTLANALRDEPALSPHGGAKYLWKLAHSAITILNAADYASIIADLAARRHILADLADFVPGQSAAEIIARHKGLIDRSASAGVPLINTAALHGWDQRIDIPEPEFLLGEMLSTTTRFELIGPTGLGKTNFLMAMGMAIADGNPFLHWAGSGHRHTVLYIDGEMSRRQTKSRVIDAQRRYGAVPDSFLCLNRDDYPEMRPLNTAAGQAFMDRVIENTLPHITIFDNVQALLIGDMKDEEPWQQMLPWVRDLTRRMIGQVWVHHTGHDESHGYGTKTREWQLDAVALMEKLDRQDVEMAFQIRFTKARERSRLNWSDFDTAIVTLSQDCWESTRGASVRKIPKGHARNRALELLKDAIQRAGLIPPSNPAIPPNTECVAEELWRDYCVAGMISEGSPDAQRMAFVRAAKKLIEEGAVGKWQRFVWVVR